MYYIIINSNLKHIHICNKYSWGQTRFSFHVLGTNQHEILRCFENEMDALVYFFLDSECFGYILMKLQIISILLQNIFYLSWQIKIFIHNKVHIINKIQIFDRLRLPFSSNWICAFCRKILFQERQTNKRIHIKF